jgi:hypothetical protein
VVDIDVIRSVYFRSWFVIDAAASVPVEAINLVQGTRPGYWIIFKILRLIKTFHLIRMLPKLFPRLRPSVIRVSGLQVQPVQTVF